MPWSDSTQDLYRLLQEEAKAARRPRVVLPPRRRAGGPPPKKRWRIPPRVRQYFPYVVIFLAILAPLLHNPPRNNKVPAYLIGAWKTTTPEYEDRYLLFAEHNVAFGTGKYEGESYIVAEVQESPVDDGTQDGASKKKLVLIRYMKPDRLEYSLSFYYEPEPGATITFKNQENLKWTKKGPDA